MKVLMACAGGMSSGFIADAIKAAAIEQGETDFEIKATSDSQVKSELDQTAWDIILLAPQVKFQAAKISEIAEPKGVPVYNIEGTLYTMMGAPKIYADIKEIVNK